MMTQAGCRPKPPEEQIEMILSLIPDLNPDPTSRYLRDVSNRLGAPGWVEGLFCIPLWEKFAPVYNEGVEIVLAAIETQRKGKFNNSRKGQLGPQLQQHAKTAKAFQVLREKQNDPDILVVPAQFGRYRDRSSYQAREAMDASEFGFGAFAVGVVLLTHPEWDDLKIDCPGDEYVFITLDENKLSSSVYFEGSGGQLRFSSHWAHYAFPGFRSPSGFLGSINLGLLGLGNL